LVNGYFVFGLNESQLGGSASTVFLAERRSNAVGASPPNCDVIFRPWYNSSNPLAPRNDMDEETGAIATHRHLGSANYLFADDHAETLEFSRVWGPPNNNLVTP
jgi:prepilin-type processing-associated H-X9-DG protein